MRRPVRSPLLVTRCEGCLRRRACAFVPFRAGWKHPRMNLLLVAGQLWRQIPSTGGWYTVDECGPSLYRYAYSDDPARDVLAPAHSEAGGLGGNSEARREEPEAYWSALGPAGRTVGKDTTKP